MTNETLETIKNRRSCRAYKPEQITNEELDAVLEAGTYAASAGAPSHRQSLGCSPLTCSRRAVFIWQV